MLISGHLKFTLRNLRSNILYVTTSVAGLSVGLAIVMLIGLIIRFETTYDNFFDDSKRIYRIALNRIYPDELKSFGITSVQLAPKVVSEIEDVLQATRLHRQFFKDEIKVTVGESEETFVENHFYFADSNFFDVFSYKFLLGKAEEALIWPYAVVLTESTANRYFGTINVLDKTIKIDDQLYLISGVVQDCPVNSHIQFDLLGSILSLDNLNEAIDSDNWTVPWVYTYVKLKSDAKVDLLGSKIQTLIDQYASTSIKRDLGEDYIEKGHYFSYFIQPISFIHLHSNLEVELGQNGDITLIWILLVIGLAIFILSSVNFVNIAIARSASRAKEIGMRKVMGSSRFFLVRQFLLESMIICLVAACISLLLLVLLMGFVNDYLGLTISFSLFNDTILISSFAGFVLLIGLIAGIYPAILLSSMDVTLIINGVFKHRRKGQWLRNSLIGLQFFIAISMIMISGVFIDQIRFLKQKDLGFKKDQVLVIRKADILDDQLDQFLSHLKSDKNIVEVGGTNLIPGNLYSSDIFKSTKPNASAVRANTCLVDSEFIAAMGMEIVKGGVFTDVDTSEISVMVNETAAKLLRLQSPVGEQLISGFNETGTQSSITYRITGVVADFHFESLHNPIRPMIMIKNPNEIIPTIIVVRFDKPVTDQSVKIVEDYWQKFTQSEINIERLSSETDILYTQVENTASVLGIFTFIAIIISCTGLFGLATYKINQQSKEMSMRKVLGAGGWTIFLLFSKTFIRLLLYSFVFAVPLAWFISAKWLDSFAFHINFNIYHVLTALASAILMILISVGYQTLKITALNPIILLRKHG